MSRHRLRADETGVSEMTGVVVLVLFTVLVTASVGLQVLVFEHGSAGGPTQANFSYQYIESGSALLVTFEHGDDIRAGNLTLENQAEHSVTWAELAGGNESRIVASGDSVQLSEGSAFGASVSTSDQVAVYYLQPDGNRSKLSEWP